MSFQSIFIDLALADSSPGLLGFLFLGRTLFLLEGVGLRDMEVRSGLGYDGELAGGISFAMLCFQTYCVIVYILDTRSSGAPPGPN